MKTTRILAPFLALLLVSCPAWDDVTRQTALDAIGELESRGTLTTPQADATREAIERAASGFDWTELAKLLGEIAAAAGLAFLGVQRTRGAPKPMSSIEAAALRELARRELEQPKPGA